MPRFFAARTRFHFAGEVAIPSSGFLADYSVPLLGAALGMEFGAMGRLRPTLDLGMLHASVNRPSVLKDVQFYYGLLGVKLFTGPRQNGFYLSTSWGICQPWSLDAGREELCITLGAGASVFNRLDLSYRFQAFTRSVPEGPAGTDLTAGLSVIRVGFFLGGNPREAVLGNESTARPGTLKARLIKESARADSLAERAQVLESESVRKANERDELIGDVRSRDEEVERLTARLDSMSRNDGGNQQVGLRYRPMSEDPSRFNANAVYTILHAFSDPTALDTFRVVTTTAANGGMRHELRISTAQGNMHRQSIHAVPLTTTTHSGTRADAELELLRVRMTLAPGAFVMQPISANDWRLSEERDARDLFYNLSKEQFSAVFRERPAVGFRFHSDEQTVETLVYSRALERIVNVNPQ